MGELLKKEKAFHEINEKLNKISIQRPVNVGSGGGGSPQKKKNFQKNLEQARYTARPLIQNPRNNNSTFIKKQGMSTFLKKQGAGDFTQYGGGGSIVVSKKSPRNEMGPIPAKGLPSSQKNRPVSNGELILRYKNLNYSETPSSEILIQDNNNNNNNSNNNHHRDPQQQQHHVHNNDSNFIANSGNISGRPINKQPIATAREQRTYNDKKKLNTESLIKYLKSKVSILEEEHNTLHRELAKQKEFSEKSAERNKVLETQRDQAVLKNNALTEQVHRLETLIEEADTRLKEKGHLQNQLQKEIEELRRQVKFLSQSRNVMEKRLHRAHEEIQASKTSIASLKNSERELQDATRIDIESKDRALKNHKKMRSELLNAIRKQLYLIDNLGRQNVCLEQAACLTITEREFNKFLESKMSAV